MVQIPDVNVLVAMVDPESPSYIEANAWFQAQQSSGWATCPITENGLIRVICNPRYPTGRVPFEQAIDVLQRLKDLQGHQFVADDFSIVDAPEVKRLTGHNQLTDLYLVELCRRHGMKLATFDSKMKYLPKSCQFHIEFL